MKSKSSKVEVKIEAISLPSPLPEFISATTRREFNSLSQQEKELFSLIAGTDKPIVVSPKKKNSMKVLSTYYKKIHKKQIRFATRRITTGDNRGKFEIFCLANEHFNRYFKS